MSDLQKLGVIWIL